MARVEVTTYIEVDLEEVKDEDLMDEVRRRGLLNGRPSFSDGISDFLGGLGYKGAVTTEFAKKGDI